VWLNPHILHCKLLVSRSANDYVSYLDTFLICEHDREGAGLP
jgi:hypothetical protein